MQPSWRKGDSFWALCTSQELDAALARLRELDMMILQQAFEKSLAALPSHRACRNTSTTSPS